jgi:ABC-2 type transport system ATP-binding protein
VTSIDPEILILDEGIGAVDAEFLEKARDRLNDLVKRSGMLVFASHSDEFLVELCSTAIWMDKGGIREEGSLREVLTHYKGYDPFNNLSEETLARIGESRATIGSEEGP